MAIAKPSVETVLRLQRTFAAPREKVFRAWTDPEELKKWCGPRGRTTPLAEIDLQAGGKYRIGMKEPEGEVFYVTGAYREVRPPERLVFTWLWEEDDMGTGETLVTVEFRAQGNSTEVTLTHELFPNQAARDRHEWGWGSSLDRLATELESRIGA